MDVFGRRGKLAWNQYVKQLEVAGIGVPLDVAAK